MFEQSLVLETGQGRKSWTLAASIAGELLAISGLALIPLLYPQALPLVVQAVILRLPFPPPPPAPEQFTHVPTRPVPRVFTGLHAPIRIPDHIATIVEQPAAPELPAIGAGRGVPGGIGESMTGRFAIPVPMAPPPKPLAEKSTSAAARKPVAVGGNVQEAKLVKRVIPVYPQLARAARISGVVKLVGVIATDGTIQQLQVISGHPLLVRAALDAVRQWVYRPTLLNGTSVEVIAPIEVIFTLGR
jgi:protein TonB